MRVSRIVPIVAVVFLMPFVGGAYLRGGPLTNGSLTVDIRTDNGAIDTVLFGGTDYFNPGIPVSDFGLQNGTNTSTFVVNTTDGITMQPVSVSGVNVVTGTFTGGGANVSFARSYSLVPGLNVLRVATGFTNHGSPLTLSYFDAFDPDQGTNLGLGPPTYNDVFGLAGGRVGQARINGGGLQHTVIAGSLDPRVTVASGNPFFIRDGNTLNNFFAAPFDGNDTFADEGTHIGLRTSLGSGQSTSFTYDLAFGLTPADAQFAFTQANAVPEPSTVIIWSLLGGLSVALAWRRKRKAG